MKKKLILGLAGLGAVLIMAPLFAAFEAHVINVTAQIENALFVHPASLRYGTVFPQEHLDTSFFISFSESFSADEQDRVGTVAYALKQKPKPLPAYVTQVGVGPARAWCHDNYPSTPYDPNDPAWTAYLANCYPSLCSYLSKTPDGFPSPGNDTGVPAFHDPNATSSVAHGKINKFGADVGDNWIIDLAVPCFKGQCAQDWGQFVLGINPNAGDPAQYELPPQLEHQVFGCDLWVEVTDIY